MLGGAALGSRPDFPNPAGRELGRAGGCWAQGKSSRDLLRERREGGEEKREERRPLGDCPPWDGHSVPPGVSQMSWGGQRWPMGGLDLGLEVGDSPGEGPVGREGVGKCGRRGGRKREEEELGQEGTRGDTG